MILVNYLNKSEASLVGILDVFLSVESNPLCTFHFSSLFSSTLVPILHALRIQMKLQTLIHQ